MKHCLYDYKQCGPPVTHADVVLVLLNSMVPTSIAPGIGVSISSTAGIRSCNALVLLSTTWCESLLLWLDYYDLLWDGY